MGDPFSGELAALGTACCWTVTALSFEAASRRVGSLAVNLIRLILAAFFVAIWGWITRGHPLPTDATMHAWLWLGLSGLVGFSIGDLCLFRAFVVLGARLTMLVFALTPLITALIGLAFLGEQLTALDWLGMGCTIGGVAWVVAERVPRNPGGSKARGETAERVPIRSNTTQRVPIRGVLLAMGAAAGQAIGLVMSKHGMGSYDAFAANQIRILAGIAGFSILFFAIRWWPKVFSALTHRPAMLRTSLGAVFGPFLGVSLSLIAVRYTTTGVAATIMSLVPVLIIAPSILLFREKISLRAVGGALIAVAGVALLFLQ